MCPRIPKKKTTLKPGSRAREQERSRMDPVDQVTVPELLAEFHARAMELERQGGPEENGPLFEECISLQEAILARYKLMPTSVNMKIMYDTMKGDLDDAEIQETMARFEERAAARRTLGSDPLKILYQGLEEEQEPYDVLSEMGVSTHGYHFFLLACFMCGELEVEEAYGEMLRAEAHLGAIGRLKGEADSLREAGLIYVGN